MTSTVLWKSPLEGFENLEPLPTTINSDGKSLYNPPGPKSASYDEFPEPIDSSNNGFDFHSMRYLKPYNLEANWRYLTHNFNAVYYIQSNELQKKYACELHERIRREFPEVGSKNLFLN